ncbi:MAG: arylesterase [Bacteriovoracaceae bacterium]
MKLLLMMLFVATSLQAKTILFIGDSLTEGYGIDSEKSYPSLIQNELGEKVSIINGSVSGSTTASGLSRLRWFLKSKPEVLVLALGANDGLRGIDLEKSKINLEKIIDMAKENKIKVILAGMMLPPNYGADYTKEFKNMFEKLAKDKKVELIPFLLKGVAAEPEYNLEDGIHPNEKGHEKMKDTVLRYLRPLI